MGGGQPYSVALRSYVNRSLEDINMVTWPATIEGHWIQVKSLLILLRVISFFQYLNTSLQNHQFNICFKKKNFSINWIDFFLIIPLWSCQNHEVLTTTFGVMVILQV